MRYVNTSVTVDTRVAPGNPVTPTENGNWKLAAVTFLKCATDENGLSRLVYTWELKQPDLRTLFGN